MLQQRAIDAVVSRALDEDLGSGDLTSLACVDAGTRASAEAVARQPVVVCGGEVFRRAFQLVDAATEVELTVGDGQRAPLGAALWRVRGSARSLLMAERVALNFVQRMCGIATLARAFVDARPPGTTARIADTRKTTPGLRFLERY